MALPVHMKRRQEVSPEEETVFTRTLTKWLSLVVLATVLSAIGSAASAEDETRHVKTKVAPAYPELAKRMNVTGIVKLQVTIAPNGTVKTARAIGGHPLLVDPAIEAVKKWKYEPANEETINVVEFRFDNN
jgi:protein TonB